jgi:uncharacterized protein (TIGR02302 family)
MSHRTVADPPDTARLNAGRLAARLRLARLALWWERLWPALVPPLSLAAAFAALVLFDALPLLPGWLHALALSAFAGGFGFTAWRHLSVVKSPDDDEAARRLERDSGLAHRPLAALADRMAGGDGDAVAAAMWRLHLSRMAECAERLRVGWPSPGMPARDPLGLRFAALLLLVVAMIGGWSDAPRRLQRAFSPAVEAPGAGAVALELWITPPAYTSLPPIRLRAGQAQDAATVVPQGSSLLAVLTGGFGRASLVLDGRSSDFQRQGDGSQRLEARLDAGSRLAVDQGWRTVAAWPVAVVRDATPSIAFAGPPQPAERGRLKIAVEASDDYGLAKAWVTIRRLGGPDGEEPLTVELPLPGKSPKAASFSSWHDLTAHPWAGLPVRMVPSAADGIGQVGSGEAVTATLPERSFANPVAKAVVEHRRLLSENRSQGAAVGEWLAALTADPAAIGGDAKAFLALRLARSELAESGFDLADVQDLMWNAALRIEEGDLSAAETALDEARRALEQALNADAPAGELQRLLDQYKAALRRFLDAMAALQGQSPGDRLPGDATIGEDELARMIDGMRGLAETGNRDALRQMLSNMTRILSGLQAPHSPDAAAGQAAKAMQDLRELSRRQQGLMDQSFAHTRPESPLDQTPPDGGEAATGGRDGQSAKAGRTGAPPNMSAGKPSAEAGKAAQAQQALQQALDQVSRSLSGAMGQAPSALGDAGAMMKGAASSLSQGAWGSAAEQQGEAMRLMKEGAEQLLQQLENGQGSGQFGAVPRDPFGRPMRGAGVGDDGSTRIPEHAEIQRAREILDELRRRAGEWQRPELERDYLQRLLKQF